MSVYYCPKCGNTTIHGAIEIFGSSFEKHENVTRIVKKRIKEGKICLDEQKICFVCEEVERRRNFKEKIVSTLSSVVNSCVECFDLQINGVWQRFTYEQKENLRKAFLIGSLYINGESVKECLHCQIVNSFAR